MVELFAGISVKQYEAALEWYGKLLGKEPDIHPNDEEAMWELGDQRFVYVRHRPDHAGHSLVTLMVDDLDTRLAGIADRGLEPSQDETYGNGVRKVTFTDPEGNETAFGTQPS